MGRVLITGGGQRSVLGVQRTDRFAFGHDADRACQAGPVLGEATRGVPLLPGVAWGMGYGALAIALFFNTGAFSQAPAGGQAQGQGARRPGGHPGAEVRGPVRRARGGLEKQPTTSRRQTDHARSNSRNSAPFPA